MDDELIPSRQLVEAASWRLAAELMRRNPTRLRLTESHPGGGQYDCLSLSERKHANPTGLEAVANLDLNRSGRAHVHARFDGAPLRPADEGGSGPISFEVWPAMIAAEDPREVVRAVATQAGLPLGTKVPPSTPEVLTVRFIAAFLSHAVFGRRRWECRNGCLDTSGYNAGMRNDLFAPFPDAQRDAEQTRPDDLFGIGAYRYWFLVSEEAEVCLSSDGVAWRPDGRRFDLGEIYEAEGRRIWPLISAVAGDLLP